MTSSDRVALLCAAALALASPLAWAQAPRAPTAQELETARSLYKEGKALRAQGDLAGAIEKLRAAHALGNTPVTGIELARAYVSAGKLVDAREVCLGIARTPVAPDETEKSAEARVEAGTMAEELKRRIATLVISVAGLPSGQAVHLAIDGAAVPDVAETQEQRLDPGKHEFVARAGDGAASRELRGVVRLAEGQTQKVTLAFPPQPAPEPAQSAPEPAHSLPATPAVLVRVGVVTGAAAVVLGSIAGVVAWRKSANLASECNSAKKCDSHFSGAQDLQSAYDWASVSTASFVVAGIGAVIAAVGLLTAPPDDRASAAGLSYWFGSGAAGLHGRF